jgi:SAM-dependent methyltransferase
MIKPFIDFYTKLDVIPTHQDISNLKAHFARRRGLCIQLGIPPLFIGNRSVLEFGPGTGQNALFTASLRPADYTLVDGNKRSVEKTTEVLGPSSKRTPISILKRDILQYRTKKKFDLVLCEGLIPTQLDPAAFTEHVASFAGPGGVVVITCMDSVSLISEVLRRYLAFYECGPEVAVEKRIRKLTKFFKPHFEQLPGMSRRHDEWVIDNIIHPWSGPLFSIAEAIKTLEGRFVVLGSSPNYMNDWRWYKQIIGEESSSVAGAEESYWRNLHSFIDHRSVLPQREVGSNKRLLQKADRLYRRIHTMEKTGKEYAMADLARDLKEVNALIGLPKSQVSLALQEYIKALKTYQGSWPVFRKFSALWGRGQQYISFVRL